MKTIAFDIDDVIADGTEIIRVAVNDRFGLSLTAEDYNVEGDYWGYYERVWQSHGLDLELPEVEGDMADDQSHVPLLAGAAVALTELSRRFKIVLITSRDARWEQATKNWLKQHFADAIVEVYFAKSPRYTTGTKTKGELCRDLGASWLVDDNPEHCLSAIEHGIDAVLFGNYGWHYKAPDHLVRCKDWPAVVDYFDGKHA